MKLPLVMLLTLSLVSAFTIIKQEESLQDVNWPFKVCGNGTWTMKSLTLSNIPSRINNVFLTARGIADSKTELSTVEAKIKMNGYQTDDVFIDFEQSLNPGEDLEFGISLYTPAVPPGSYELTFNHLTKAGDINGCWSFSFDLK